MSRIFLLALALLFTAVLCPRAVVQAAVAADASAQSQSTPDIVMYATQTCGYCAKARTWFKSKNLAWEERDIETSAVANKEWKTLGGQGTPLIVIDGERIHGFDQVRIEAALAKQGVRGKSG